MKRWLRIVLIVMFSLCFIVSGISLVRYYWNAYQNKQQYGQLQQIMEQARPVVHQLPQQEDTPEEVATTTENATETVSELVSVTDPDTGLPVQVLPEFSELYALNRDIVGWIAIPDTNINYPVMHTPDRTDYYLYRDFYGKDSVHGCIYIREACNVETPSDNVVIYGHRMKDGSMFHNLSNYEKKEFYEAHKYIQFDTLQQRHLYEVVAVFKTVATSQGFDYHLFVNAYDEADYDDFIAQCKAHSFYDTGVSARYGDKLITLSTCEYSQDNGRMVIVAKRIN